MNDSGRACLGPLRSPRLARSRSDEYRIPVGGCSTIPSALIGLVPPNAGIALRNWVAEPSAEPRGPCDTAT